MFLFWLFIIICFVPFHIIAPHRVIGKRNIKGKKNYIIASNHRSNFDAIILDYTFGKRVRYLAKTELFKTKFSSFFMRNIFGCIEIDRDKGISPSKYREIDKILTSKQTLGIFPQGTRNENISVKGGVCYFAIKYKKPIVPCYIVNKQRFMKKNLVLLGVPFELDEFYDKKLDKEMIEKADNVLLGKINALKEEYEARQKEKKLVKHIKKNK